MELPQKLPFTTKLGSAKAAVRLSQQAMRRRSGVAGLCSTKCWSRPSSARAAYTASCGTRMLSGIPPDVCPVAGARRAGAAC